MYAESCAKADQLYQIRKNTLWQEYQVVQQNADRIYNNEVTRCNQIAQKVLQNQQMICRSIYKNKEGYISKLKSKNAELCAQELRDTISEVNAKCSNKCDACRLIISAIELYEESNDDGFFDIVKRELSSKNAELKRFKRRKDKLSWEDNLRATNPRFYESRDKGDKKFTHNCQRCVMAYEVRCRGFDVTAKERQLLDDTLPIMNHPQGWPSVFVDKNGNTPIPERLSSKTTQNAIDEIEAKMASYGDGARAIIRIGRFADDGSRLSGHVFVAEQINGKTVFCDPQSASIDAKRNFGDYNGQVGQCIPRTVKVCDPRCIIRGKSAMINDCSRCKKENVIKNSSVNTSVSVLPSDIRILRRDNLKMTSRIIDCCNG